MAVMPDKEYELTATKNGECSKTFGKADMDALGFGHLAGGKQGQLRISVDGGVRVIHGLKEGDDVPINWKAGRGASHGPQTAGWTLHMILVAQAAKKMDTGEEDEEDEYEEDEEVDEHLYCVCQKRDSKDKMMVGCDKEGCPHGEWFHLGCVGLRAPPPKESAWLCPRCLCDNEVGDDDSEL
jgi:hypothetical protein